MIAANLVAPVTAALIKSAFRMPTKNKLIIVKDGQVSVVVSDDTTGEASEQPSGATGK